MGHGVIANTVSETLKTPQHLFQTRHHHKKVCFYQKCEVKFILGNDLALALYFMTNSYAKAAGFPSFSLFIFSYKAAVNLHSWNHFSCLEKAFFFSLSPTTWAVARGMSSMHSALTFLWFGPLYNLTTLPSTSILSLSLIFFILFFCTHWTLFLCQLTVYENLCLKTFLKTLWWIYKYDWLSLCEGRCSFQNSFF